MTNTAFGEQQVAELTPVAGWTFAYNVNADLVTSTTTGSGTVTADAGRAKLSTGAAISSSAKIETKLPLRYVPGQGGVLRITAVFSTPKVGSTQMVGLGDANDGLFFGYNGTSFGILRRSAGSDTWTAFASWSDSFYSLGTNGQEVQIDPTKGNVYQIQFQWLGYGELKFYMEFPETGAFRIVHRIKYVNANTGTSLRNPTLPVMAMVENTTNNTDIVLYTPSAMAFVEGKVENPAPPHPLALNRTLVASDTGITTQHNLLTLSNQATWQTIANRIRARVRRLTVAVDGTKNVTVRVIKNTTLGGTPSYTDYNANTSPIQYDTAGTTITGGTVVFAATLQKVDAKEFDLDSWGIDINPGDKLTISAASTSAVDVDIALNWVDLL